MADFVDDSLRNTGEVMQELVLKAGEARRAGRTRRDFFASTAKLAGATALGAAGAGLLQPIAAKAATSGGNTDTAQNILDIAATAEALAVTFYFHGLQAGMNLPDVNSTANRNYFQAATVQETEHLLYLEKFGAAKPPRHFFFPNNMFTDQSVFFQTALTLEAYFISAYLAAALDFSGAVSSNMTTANPTFLGFAVQVLGVECEHRALLGVAANVNPPNGIIIESALVKTVQDAGAALAPFLTGGEGYAGPLSLPTSSAINKESQPYGFSFFPRFTID
jgi:hypothetical protein